MKLYNFPDASSFTVETSTDNARKLLTKFQSVRSMILEEYLVGRKDVKRYREIFKEEFERGLEMFPLIGYDYPTRSLLTIQLNPSMFKMGGVHRLKFDKPTGYNQVPDYMEEEGEDEFVEYMIGLASSCMIPALYDRNPTFRDCVFAYSRTLCAMLFVSMMIRCFLRDGSYKLSDSLLPETKIMIGLMVQRIDSIIAEVFAFNGVDPVKFMGPTTVRVYHKHVIYETNPDFETLLAMCLCTPEGAWTYVCPPPEIRLDQLVFPSIVEVGVYVKPK